MSGPLWFLLGVVVGSCFGLVLTALLVAAKRGDGPAIGGLP